MPNHLSRRTFVKNITSTTGLLCCGSLGISALLEGCQSAKNIQAIVSDNKIRIDKIEFESNSFLVLNNDRLTASIYLLKINENEYRALLMLCTHKDCELRATGTFLTCPCHGSEFSNEGKVLSGPAMESLKGYKVADQNTHVIVDLNQPIQL